MSTVPVREIDNSVWIRDLVYLAFPEGEARERGNRERCFTDSAAVGGCAAQPSSCDFAISGEARVTLNRSLDTTHNVDSLVIKRYRR
jgi:hypothetical protein